MINAEMSHDTRRIPTDNSSHLPSNVRQWFGDPRAHWEGDTLVVDTKSFNGKTWLDTEHERLTSDALHVIERIQYTDPMTASYRVTIDDPKIFTAPWSQDFGMKLHPTWKLYEQVCEENNRCENGKCTDSDAQKSSKE